MNNSKLTDIALLVLRVVAGGLLLYYGGQKLVGWFGGVGFSAQIEGFRTHLGIPPALGILAICAEFFGGLGLIFGFLTRLAAFGAVCNMAVATFVKIKAVTTLVAVPTSLDPLLRDPISGPAYPLMLMTMCLTVLLIGAGSISLDQRFFGKRGKRPKT